MKKDLFIPVLIIVFHTVLYYSNSQKFTPGDYSGRDLVLTATGLLAFIAAGYLLGTLIAYYRTKVKDSEPLQLEETPTPLTLEESCGVSSTTWIDGEPYKFSRPLKQGEHIGWMSRLPGGKERINTVREAFNLSK